MKSIHLLILFAGNCFYLHGQHIGIGTNAPHTTALLEIKASNKGLLIPRTSTASRTGIVNPAKGLILYDSTTSSFWYHSGSAWVQVENRGRNWSTSGNAGTNQATHFFGTTDVSPIVFKVNNVKSGIIDTITFNSAIGFRTLDSVTTGTHNAAFGYKALNSNKDGFQNTAVGSNALRKNTSGGYNTAVGMQALASNIDGTGNTAVGMQALISNSNGSGNTAIGNAGLFLNTGGSNNIAIGSGALFSNSTADNNISIGFQSLNSNTTGYSNVAIGVRALHVNSTKSNLVAVGDSALFNNGTNASTTAHAISNTAVGSKTLFSNTTGSQNAAVGYQSLFLNETGDNNNAHGTYALYKNTSGSFNNASGSYSLHNNNSGSYNNAIGSFALFQNTSGNTNVAIGYWALAANTNRSNLVAVGDSALHKNGIGATQNVDATGNTAVGSKSLYENTTGNANTALGKSALYNNNTGAGNTAVGFNALDGNASGSNNTAIGANSGTTSDNLENTTAVGAGAKASASHSLVLGNNANVGIGTSAPIYKLDVRNTASTYINVKSNLASGIILDKGAPGDVNSISFSSAGTYKWTLGTNGSEIFRLRNASTGYDAIIVNDANNNVGIGTVLQPPAARLQVHSPNVANQPTGDIVMSRYWPGSSDTRASSVFHFYNSGNSSDNLAFAVSGDGGSYGQPNAIGQIKMNILANGRVGIGTITPSEKLEVVGLINALGYRCRPGTAGFAGSNSFNIYWTGASAQLWVDATNIGTFSYVSDRRLKDQIGAIDNDAIYRMLALKPVHYNFKNIEGSVFPGNPDTQEGFIADELQQVIPSAVNGEKNALTTKGTIQPQTINVIPVVAVLTRAMQEQQHIIEWQSKKIEGLEKQIQQLKIMQADIEMLKAALLSKK